MSHAKLELKGIGKSYKDGDTSLTILKDLNLSVEAGEFVAILGPSGSGKSTLLSIAGLLLTADAGAIYLDGEKVSSNSQKDLTKLRREQLGFIYFPHSTNFS